MKCTLVALALIVVAAAAMQPLTQQETSFVFAKWMKEHGKKYQDAAEFDARLTAFKKNVEIVRKHQADPKRTFDMALNQFADLSSQEFAERYLGYVPQNRDFLRSKNEVHLSTRGNPASVDWSQKGVVTPVKNQEQCGSCWAFSTTGSVEAAYAIASGNLVSLSEQELVDCSGSAGNQGCEGGLMDNAFNWIISNGGLCTEGDYPYTAQDGTCQTNCTSAVTITGFTDVPPNDESQLESAVVLTPVSIAVEADQSAWQLYSGGIVMASTCGTQLDHGVLLVGYGTDGGQAYWKVKNSWGASWGEQGYIRLQKGAGGAGTCGLCSDPSYPTGAKAV
jgi:C1A family cysteine protease